MPWARPVGMVFHSRARPRCRNGMRRGSTSNSYVHSSCVSESAVAGAHARTKCERLSRGASVRRRVRYVRMVLGIRPRATAAQSRLSAAVVVHFLNCLCAAVVARVCVWAVCVICVLLGPCVSGWVWHYMCTVFSLWPGYSVSSVTSQQRLPLNQNTMVDGSHTE